MIEFLGNLQMAFLIAYLGMGIHRQVFSKRFIDNILELFGFARRFYPRKKHVSQRRVFLLGGAFSLGMTTVLRIFIWPAFVADEVREEG